MTVIKLNSEQIELIRAVGGLPSVHKLSEAIKENPQKYNLLRPLLKTGLNLDEVARRYDLGRNLRRTTGSVKWDSDDGRKALIDGLAELVNTTGCFYSGRSLLKCHQQLTLCMDKSEIGIKAMSLPKPLKDAFWPDNNNGKYSNLHIKFFELVKSGQINIPGFSYSKMYEKENIKALSSFLESSVKTWSTKGIKHPDIDLEWTYMVYLAVLLSIYSKCPSIDDIRKLKHPLLNNCSSVFTEMKDDTPLLDYLPPQKGAKGVFEGYEGLTRLKKFISDLLKEYGCVFPLTLLKSNPDVSHSDVTIRRAIKKYGYTDIYELQKEIINEQLIDVNLPKAHMLAIDSTGIGSAGELKIRRTIEAPTFKTKVEKLGYQFSYDVQCNLSEFDERRADGVLCSTLIIEVSMVNPELFTQNKEPHNKTENAYYHNRKQYYRDLMSSPFSSFIMSSDDVVATSCAQLSEKLLALLKQAKELNKPKIEYRCDKTIQSSRTMNEIKIGKELKNTLYYQAGSRLLPSRVEFELIDFINHQSLVVIMTHTGTTDICKQCDLYFEEHLTTNTDDEIKTNSDLAKMILARSFGYLQYLPKPGYWNSSEKKLLNHYKSNYEDWEARIEALAGKKFISGRVKNLHFSKGNEPIVENIAKTFTEMHYVRAGGRIYPTKGQLERESKSGAWIPFQQILEDPLLEAKLSKLSGLISLQTFVEQALVNAEQNLKGQVSQKSRLYLATHFERMAKNDWRMSQSQKFKL
ncbi:hypothetical protein QR676_12905 [Vibrio sp. TMPB1044]|uniref:hypothetical protein n=1 Tax=Vibrio sp. TMPB1044 TaxID=3051822 RepID=UPI00255B517A|nr:hypothetical protein [Vibrio sp. TMPB1044]MDL5028133.1 hypothetical protein [Vibrio sp. TMPB1044]MDN5208261.1 hypothetical protein [Vibrio sp. TMPB1044]